MKMKTKIIVLGSGLVGAPMCIDLAKESDFEQPKSISLKQRKCKS
jgi:saccharopine dehydrogenase-like NADP-dependent oxidoreductase